MASPHFVKGLAGSANSLLDMLVKRQLIGTIYPSSMEYQNKLNQMLKKPTTVYAGFDATGESLHVGNLATLMNLIHFQRYGHRVICVIGDATTQIGDPSGHLKDRQKIDKETIVKNSDSIRRTLNRVFSNHRSFFMSTEASQQRVIDPIIINNSMWYQDKNVVDFVGEVFREVRVSGLLHKKSIQERLKMADGMNVSEFCYQIFQAYDWMELRRRFDCKLQIGGSDQAGNIYTGHDMIKKLTGESDSIGMLAPLITDGTTGKKLGKSADNSQSSIWLKPELTSPYHLFQFFHRVPDKEVEKFLQVFTLLEDREIQDLIYKHLKKPDDVWYCQRTLAENVCQLIHGKEGLQSAKRITNAFFKRNPLDIANLPEEELYQLFDSNSITHLVHQDTLRVLDLVRRANCFNSDLDAERVIKAGGLWLNGHRVTSFNVPITTDLIIGNGITVMRVGKKNYYLFKWNK